MPDATRYVAAVRRRVNRYLAPRALEQTFESVYGRSPTADELRTVNRNHALSGRKDSAGLFRTVVNGFDHHHHPTQFAVRFDVDDVDYVDIGGAQVAIDRADPSVSAPIRDGSYEQHLRPFIEEFLEPGMTFVDVGANVGFYSVLAARCVGPSGKVYSFEPSSENCRLLLLGADRNGFANISLFPVALGPAQGHAVFRHAMGSNGGLIGDGIEELLDKTAMVVPTMRLDDVAVGRVDLMKMDVEGAESLVIDGAMGLIREQRPTIVSEFSIEMLRRVSGVDGRDYLRRWVSEGYSVAVCERQTGALIPVPDVDAFVDGYGDDTRIEDLVLSPDG